MIDWKKLSDVFDADAIEWRIGQSGERDGKPWAKCFAYLTNRDIQKRLDEVAKPDNWQCEFKSVEGGFLCGIGIRVSADSGWVWKWDGAERTDFEPLKGGLSGSMKRAAVQWGIGRYLYGLEEGWAKCEWDKTTGYRYAKLDGGRAFYWAPPQLPSWALPEGSGQPPVPQGELFDDRSPPPQETPPRAPQSQPATPGSRVFKKQACPKCGLSEPVRKSKEQGKGWYCWKKIEAKDEKPGAYGCGNTWGGEDDQVEEPFSGGRVDVKSIPRAAEGSDTVDPMYRWAKFILDSKTETQQEATRNLLVKKWASRDLSSEHIFDILKCGLDHCENGDQLEVVEAQIKPLVKAVQMPEKLSLKFAELLPLTEDRLAIAHS